MVYLSCVYKGWLFGLSLANTDKKQAHLLPMGKGCACWRLWMEECYLVTVILKYCLAMVPSASLTFTQTS